ncbi:TonB-dependent receptor [Chitinophaga lutea]|uniref:TonB-dependent receptor n=1 Tax=Chitinophaga lutea TaxID=2488634 RepID=A0A3N4PZ23_9BACT|nr:TonB-dependent receptor [Chitinophaga lutea]RPE13136.1 TonB-dependent receptor [Chitinophaga lutea]
MKTTNFPLLAIALMTAAPAFAQEQDSAGVSQLNTVVVTATKFAKKQSETGKVLTVITREQIERNVGRTVTDVLNEQAGIVINGAGSNPGKNKELYFRGATSQYTPILLDGIPVADATGLTGGAIDLRLLPIDAVERIEILRGTQSTLYGADAIAGIINIITKKGGNKPVGGFGNLSWGSNRSLKGTAGLQGKHENVDYNIAFTHFETDGISEAAPFDTVANPKFDRDGYKQNSFMANVGIQATEQLRFTPYILFSDYKSAYDGGSFQDNLTNNNKSNMVHTGIRSLYDLGKGKLYANFGYQKVTRHDESAWGTTDLDGRAYFGDLYGHYDINSWLQALVGVEYRKTELMDTTLTGTRTFGIGSQYNTSPYASLFIKNLRGFSFEAGGRYTLHSQFGNHFTYTLNPSYLVADKVKVFASIASGFKAPTLTSLYSRWGNPLLKPEKATSYEAGAQTSLLGDKLDLRVTGFKRDIKDVISYINYKYVNYNKQNDKGVEVEVTARPVKGLEIKAFYTYVDGAVTTQASVPGKDTSYNNLARRPAHTGSLNVGYRFSKFYVGTNIRHTGDRDDIYYAPGSFSGVPHPLKAYTIWDMYAEFRFNNAGRVFVNANNITNNRKYWEIYGYSVQGFTMQAGIAFQL